MTLRESAFSNWMNRLFDVAIKNKVTAENFNVYRWHNRNAWADYFDKGYSPEDAFLEDLQHV